MAANIFERLKEERQPTTPIEETVTIKQPTTKITPRKATPRLVDPKDFIVDVLTNGPVPTKNVLARGAERGLTRKQIWRAREQLDIVAFKEIGPRGPWFLALPHHQR